MTTYRLTTQRGTCTFRSDQDLPLEHPSGPWARIILFPDLIVIDGDGYDIDNVEGTLHYGEHLDPVLRVAS